MVAIQTVFSKDPDKDIKILCNKKYITYKEKEDKFYLNSQLNSNITEELKPLTALHWSSQNIYTDIVLLLDNYLDRKIIYPLPLLDDFVKMDINLLKKGDMKNKCVGQDFQFLLLLLLLF